MVIHRVACLSGLIFTAAGAAKRAEGNAEHDTAQAKGWLEGVKDSVRGPFNTLLVSCVLVTGLQCLLAGPAFTAAGMHAYLRCVLSVAIHGSKLQRS